LDRLDEFVPGYTVVNLSYTTTLTISGHDVRIGAGIQNALDVSSPTRIPGLVGRQLYMQTSTRF
jgi:hypothetical protein